MKCTGDFMCEVWGAPVEWVQIGAKLVAEWGCWREDVVLELLGMPVNRALCSNIEGVDFKSVLCRGPIDCFEGVIVIRRRMLAAMSILESWLKGDKWVKIWVSMGSFERGTASMK